MDFLTDLVQGDNVIIYLFEPNASKKQSSLSITRVIHAYKNTLPELYGNLGGSWSCNNDIACYSAWATESDAVALVLLSSGSEWCSGSLLMTANQNFRSFFLSAFHCIDVSQDEILSNTEISDAQNWLFKFQYKKTACNENGATTGITFNGAQFRSAWHDADFVLMEINTSLVSDTRFSWLGWDRTGNTPTSGTGIHHPAGDVMKISFDNNILFPNSSIIDWGFNRFSPVNTHWVVGFDNGTTQGGSSGSPLFDQNKRVIGQLHGGQSGCAPVTKYYGQFNRSWIGGLTNTTRLSNWLDPCNSGTLTTNTSRSPFLSDGMNVCSSGATFTVNNVPTGFTVSWTCSTNISFDNQAGNPKVFTAFGTGAGTITATLNSTSCGTIPLPPETVWVGTPSTPTSISGFCCNGMELGSESIYIFSINPPSIQGVNQFNWVVAGGTILEGQGTGTITVKTAKATGSQQKYFDVSVRVANDCNIWSGYLWRTGYVTSGVGPARFTVYPNPATTDVSVSVSDVDLLSATENSKNILIKSIQVIDYYGNIRKIKKDEKGSKSLTINVSDLQKGIYIILISDGVTEESHKLMIEK